jgi:hypothetical protein
VDRAARAAHRGVRFRRNRSSRVTTWPHPSLKWPRASCPWNPSGTPARYLCHTSSTGKMPVATLAQRARCPLPLWLSRQDPLSTPSRRARCPLPLWGKPWPPARSRVTGLLADWACKDRPRPAEKTFFCPGKAPSSMKTRAFRNFYTGAGEGQTHPAKGIGTPLALLPTRRKSDAAGGLVSGISAQRRCSIPLTHEA